jgi:hypothetical protein
MAELGDEELSSRKPTEEEKVNNEFRDIGWYTNSNGYKQYGIIPRNNEENYEWTRSKTSDTWLYNDDI